MLITHLRPGLEFSFFWYHLKLLFRWSGWGIWKKLIIKPLVFHSNHFAFLNAKTTDRGHSSLCWWATSFLNDKRKILKDFLKLNWVSCKHRRYEVSPSLSLHKVKLFLWVIFNRNSSLIWKKTRPWKSLSGITQQESNLYFLCLRQLSSSAGRLYYLKCK